MPIKSIIIICFVLASSAIATVDQETCSADHLTCSSATRSSLKTKRYLLYDVNPGEGFNLRRDVYMRVAILVQKLNEKSQEEWMLVLPPWGPLYHWQSENLGPQLKLPWSTFFDIASLSKYVPVMEFTDFLNENGPKIEEVYYLQNYAEGWENGNWEERMDLRECIETHHYEKDEDGFYSSWFWGYSDAYAIKFSCLSVQGYGSTLIPLLQKSKARSIMIDRAEVILHDHYGDKNYWAVRRSMRFASHLINIGNHFRENDLDSSDAKDGTVLHSDWQEMKPEKNSAIGGPYLSIHLRRKDFVHSRSNDVPSIANAAKQIEKKLKELSLSLVFIATDAPQNEFEELKAKLHKVARVLRFRPTKEILNKYKDGGVAIIDQWICAHARYFIGSYESTFSFRIQEEREILGFHPDTTFNRLCGDKQVSCEQPSRWLILYD